MSLEPRRAQRSVPLAGERAAYVFGFLAEFADAYPDLCEGDKRFYRDLCRAALVGVRDDADLEAMRIGSSLDEVLTLAASPGPAAVARSDVAYWFVRRLRRLGVRLRFEGDRFHAGPARLLTAELQNDIRRQAGVNRVALAAAVIQYQAAPQAAATPTETDR